MGIQYCKNEKNLLQNLITDLLSVYKCDFAQIPMSKSTIQTLCIGTDRSRQTVQTMIRLLLKKQSDQGLRCLPFHQHLLDALMQCYIKLFFYFRTIMAIV